MIDLSIIIVNWNSTAYLLRCLESIYAHTHEAKFEVIVVDNASSDGDFQLVKERYLDVVLIESTMNLGFAGANNVGFRAARGRCVVFLNPDTVLINPAFDLMIRQLNLLSDAGSAGCTLLNEDRSVQTSAIQMFPTILNQLLDLNALRNRFPACRLWDFAPLFAGGTEPSRVEVISGACIMLRREVFAQIGLFSEEYFMYAEDLDLCWKAAHAGFTNYYIPQGQIVHYGGKSSTFERAVLFKWKAVLKYVAKYRGNTYQFAFRLAIACSAIARLALLVALLVVSRGARKRSIRIAILKWRLILETMFAYGEQKQPEGSLTEQEAQGR